VLDQGSEDAVLATEVFALTQCLDGTLHIEIDFLFHVSSLFCVNIKKWQGILNTTEFQQVIEWNIFWSLPSNVADLKIKRFEIRPAIPNCINLAHIDCG
jgi:hypothetical protein